MSSFFFNDTATTEIYTLSLHDALPIFAGSLHFREAAAFPVRGAGGEITALAAVIRDTTRQHEAEADRSRLLKDALQARAQAEAAMVRAESALAQAERSEEHTSELQSRQYLVCRLLLE